MLRSIIITVLTSYEGRLSVAARTSRGSDDCSMPDRVLLF